MPQIKTTELKGWLFDVYADRQAGLTLWFIGEDGARYRFGQHFPISFYLAGEDQRLQPVRDYLSKLKMKLFLPRGWKMGSFMVGAQLMINMLLLSLLCSSVSIW